MKIIDCKQGSPEWLEARRGIPTASNFDKMVTPGGKLSAQAEDYICELIAERFYLGAMDELSAPATTAMRNGLEVEPSARQWYELLHDVDVQQVGLCLTDDGRVGCSPDGLVGESGGVEIKCPNGKTHVRYLWDGGLPDKYKPQVHGAMIVTGRAWWDFVSYVPGLPPLFVRVEPNEYTELLQKALAEFVQKYDDIFATLKLTAPESPPAKHPELTEDEMPAMLVT